MRTLLLAAIIGYARGQGQESCGGANCTVGQFCGPENTCLPYTCENTMQFQCGHDITNWECSVTDTETCQDLRLCTLKEGDQVISQCADFTGTTATSCFSDLKSLGFDPENAECTTDDDSCLVFKYPGYTEVRCSNIVFFPLDPPSPPPPSPLPSMPPPSPAPECPPECPEPSRRRMLFSSSVPCPEVCEAAGCC